MNHEPVLVLSTPRSGSSWTARVLACHRDLHVYTHDAGDSLALYGLQPLRSVLPLVDDRSRRSPARGPGGALQRRALRRYIRPGSGVPVIATPTAAAFLPALLAAFPAARVVRVARDPHDTVSSLAGFLERRGRESALRRVRVAREIGAPLPWLRAGAHLFHRVRWAGTGRAGYLGVRPPGYRRLPGASDIEYCAQYYAALERWTDDELRAVPPASRAGIRYEDLVLDTAATLTGVCEFLGVEPYPDFLAEAAASVTVDAIGRGRDRLAGSDIDAIDRALDGRGEGIGELAG